MSRKVPRLLLCLCLAVVVLLSAAEASRAAPSISSTSGTFAHGNSVTITGSGFGSKATAAPIKWETFEDGVVGTCVTTTSYWSLTTSGTDATFDDDTYIDLRHANSDRHVRWRSTSSNVSFDFYRENLGLTNGKAYINAWVWIDYVEGDEDNWQIKLMYLHADHNHSSRPFFCANTVTEDWETCSSFEWHYCDVIDPFGYTGGTMNGTASMIREGYWINLAMEYRDSSALNEDDGIATLFHSDAQQNYAYYTTYRDTLITRDDDHTDYVDCLSLGYRTAGDAEEGITYWDDVYIDKYWARVEIGDASTYDNCKHREMQIPSAWSSSSVTVTVNEGALADGTAYLYVVDDDGAVNSSGYQVTIGSGAAYALTVNSGSGSGTYEEDNVANISADAAASGYVFDQWTGDTAGIADIYDDTTTLTMPDADQEVTATYTDTQWTLTVNSGTGDGSYVGGAVADIDADSPASGKQFAEWVGDTVGIASVTTADTTLTMPYANAEITATYEDVPSGTTQLMVNWGDSAGNNVYDFSDWDNIYVPYWMSYSSAGPDGVVGATTYYYPTVGVNGSSESFSEGDQIVVTWYNDTGSSVTFTPKISFDDPDFYIGGSSGTWYDMTQLVLGDAASGTTSYTFTSETAGSYSRVHVCRNIANRSQLMFDKFELEQP